MQKNINVGLAFVAAAALLLALFAALNVGNVPEARGTQNFGAATFGGAVNASRGVTVTENISAGTGLQAAGDSIFWSDVTIDDDVNVGGDVAVTGWVLIWDDLLVVDDFWVFGDYYLAGSTNVTGTVIVTGTIIVTEGITVSENISAGTGIQAGGDVVFWSDLTVDDDFYVDGNADLDGALDVDDNTDLDDTQVDGEFEVTGTSILTGEVTTGGDMTIGDDLEISDDLTIGGDLYVTGHSWITTTTTITGDTGIVGDLTVSENITATGHISAGAGIHAGGASYFWDNLDVEDDLAVSNDVAVGRRITVTGDAVMNGDLTVGNTKDDSAYFYSLVETWDGDEWEQIYAPDPRNATGWWIAYDIAGPDSDCWAGVDDITAHAGYLRVSTAPTQTTTFVGAKGTALVNGVEITESTQTEGTGVWGAAWASAGGSLPYGYGFYSHLKTSEDGDFIITGTNYMAGQHLDVGGGTSGVITNSYILWTEPDTWTIGINFGDAAFATADIVLQNGETISNGIDGTITMVGNMAVGGGITVTENISVGTSIQVAGHSYYWDSVNIEDNLDVGGNTDLDDTQVDGEFEVTGTSLLTGTVTAVGNVLVGDWLAAIEQAACVVFAGSSITPTGTYQPITSAAVVTTSTSIAIVDGTIVGQLLILINENAADAITVDDGGNTRLSGDAVLGPDDTLMLIWNGADWVEIAQANNT